RPMGGPSASAVPGLRTASSPGWTRPDGGPSPIPAPRRPRAAARAGHLRRPFPAGSGGQPAQSGGRPAWRARTRARRRRPHLRAAVADARRDRSRAAAPGRGPAMTLRLYALVGDGDQALVSGMRGAGREPLRLVRGPGIAAVVGASSVATGPVTRPALERHDAIVRRLARRVPALLPARFGSGAADERELR